MSTALEYLVDASGRVSTNGVYREITSAQWDNLASIPRRYYTRYGPALEAVAQGKIIALPAPDNKRAWNIRRSVELAAKRRGLRIEARNARDPEVVDGILVLVRVQPSLDADT